MLDVKLCQMVRVLKNGELVRMSKRAGNFVTLRDVVEEVGKDVVRFTMLTRKNDASFDFDLVKATNRHGQSGILRPVCPCADALGDAQGRGRRHRDRRPGDGAARSPGRSGELALVRLIAQLPREVEAAAPAHEPHRIAFFLYDLAAAFHAHWNRGCEEPGSALHRRGRCTS